MNPINSIKRKKAVIYCRVSTKEQADEGNSLTSQERLCREYAIKNNYEIVLVYIEQGESAKTRDRTQLQNMLGFCAIKKNLINVVITYKLDRISRNLDDYSYIRILLKKYGVEIKSTTEHFENSPAGRFMENIIANVAQFDNDVRAERSIGGMKEAMREGRYVWRTPQGYCTTKIDGKSTIKPNKFSSIIQEAFLLVAQNSSSVNEIYKSLVKSNFNSGGKVISRSQFYKILKKEVYCGWINQFGERHKGKFKPLVSEELFNQVQRVLKSKSNSPKFYSIENPDFPLRRFVFHPIGYKLTGSWSKGKTKYYAYYHFWRVKGISYGKDYMESKFSSFMNEFSISGKHIEKLKVLTKRNYIDLFSEVENEKVIIKKKVEALKQEQDAYAKKSISGILSDEIVKRRIDSIEDEICLATEKLLRIPLLPNKVNELIDFIHLYLENPGIVWKNASINNKIQLQWFQFPQGVYFSEDTFGTQEICSLYIVRSLILDMPVSYSGPSISHLEPTEKAENSHKWLNVPLLEDPAFWAKVLEDTQKLYDIVHGTNSVPKDIVELMDSLDD